MKYILLWTLLQYSYGFTLPDKPIVTSFKYTGDISPTNYFDPLFLTSNSYDKDIQYVRESELQHGRIAMVSFVTLVVLDNLQEKQLAINTLYNNPQQIWFWLFMMAYEFARMDVGWVNPFQNPNKSFRLKEFYQPGNILKKKYYEYDEEILNKELSNGRLAMLGCIGYIVQEYITQSAIF